MCWTPTTLSPAGKFVLVCLAFVNSEIRSNEILAEKKIYFYAIFQLLGRLGGDCTTLFCVIAPSAVWLHHTGWWMTHDDAKPWLSRAKPRMTIYLSPFCMGFHLFMRSSSSLESCVHVCRQLIRWVMIGEELVAAAISIRIFPTTSAYPGVGMFARLYMLCYPYVRWSTSCEEHNQAKNRKHY